MADRQIDQYTFEEGKTIPNNQKLPLLVYHRVISGGDGLEEKFREAFEENNWGASWVDGVYDYHHYHSISHEVLGVATGAAIIEFGGPDGKEIAVKAGDMVVIPAGVGHCLISSKGGFKVVGAYPAGQEEYDICREKDDKEEKKKNISQVPLPEKDPIDGVNGSLMEYWKK